jgi:hypothetical protein
MWRAFERAGYAATNKIRPPKVKVVKRRKRTVITVKPRKGVG